jgi:hypothetical protein
MWQDLWDSGRSKLAGSRKWMERSEHDAAMGEAPTTVTADARRSTVREPRRDENDAAAEEEFENWQVHVKWIRKKRGQGEPSVRALACRTCQRIWGALSSSLDGTPRTSSWTDAHEDATNMR